MLAAAPAPSAAAPLSARDLEESSPPPAASGLCHLSAALCLSSSLKSSSTPFARILMGLMNWSFSPSADLTPNISFWPLS